MIKSNVRHVYNRMWSLWPCKISDWNFVAGWSALIWLLAYYHPAEVMDLVSVSWEYQLSRPTFNLSPWHHSIIYQRLDSLHGQTPWYHISNLDFEMFIPLWHLTGILVAALSRRQSNIRVTGIFQIHAVPRRKSESWIDFSLLDY